MHTQLVLKKDVISLKEHAYQIEQYVGWKIMNGKKDNPSA